MQIIYSERIYKTTVRRKGSFDVVFDIERKKYIDCSSQTYGNRRSRQIASRRGNLRLIRSIQASCDGNLHIECNNKIITKDMLDLFNKKG